MTSPSGQVCFLCTVSFIRHCDCVHFHFKMRNRFRRINALEAGIATQDNPAARFRFQNDPGRLGGGGAYW